MENPYGCNQIGNFRITDHPAVAQRKAVITKEPLHYKAAAFLRLTAYFFPKRAWEYQRPVQKSPSHLLPAHSLHPPALNKA